MKPSIAFLSPPLPVSSKQSRSVLRCSLHPPTLTRRSLLHLLLLPCALPLAARGGPPTRNVFDEERARNEEALEAAKALRLAALRDAFDAVATAAQQLDELKQKADNEDWDAVRTLTRAFNDAVEREGMEKISKQLKKEEGRKEALSVSRSVTDILIQVDRAARKKDKQQAVNGIDQVRSIVDGFQKFKP